MNITRVERDGVEFFTLNATGESGMSESGIARLCGVAQQSIHAYLKSLRTLPTGKNDVLAKSYKYPNHSKRLHLFGSEEPILETIEDVCRPWNIRVTFEKVDRLKGEDDRKLIA